jgi:hypothetical protein
MNIWEVFPQTVVDSKQALDCITWINTEVEQEVALHLINEEIIERCLSHASQLASGCPRGYWLLVARLTEATLLCAGNYADSCEFEATGDLLVNPREIIVHSRNGRQSAVKRRHGRVSSQFISTGVVRKEQMNTFYARISLETTKPPLLPHMTQMLKRSGFISQLYLRRLEECQRQIAATLGFLSAWSIFDAAELFRRLEDSSPRERAFIESHLCRFDARVFNQIGADLQQTLVEPNHPSPFLNKASDEHCREYRAPIGCTPIRALSPM